MVFEMGNGFESHSECVMHVLTNLLTLKWTYGHSGNDNRVATISKSYLTVIRIIIKSLKSVGQF